MNLQTVPLSLVDPDPDQPRTECDDQETKRLALSIRERSLLQPPIVFQLGERFQLVDGHRRFRAMLMLNAREMPAVVLASRPDAETLLLTQLTANCLRLDMSPLDKARAYRRLMDQRGWSHTELATHLHVSKGSVTQCLSYLKLSPEAQTALQAGDLAESTAYAIARAPDDKTRQAMLEAAKNGELTRDQAQQAVSKRKCRDSRTARVVCQLPGNTVTVSGPERVDLVELQRVCRRLLKECKRASDKQWDMPTLERVLANENRRPSAVLIQGET